MKFSKILKILALIFFVTPNVLFFTDTDFCSTVKPFKTINDDDAFSYQLNNILLAAIPPDKNTVSKEDNISGITLINFWASWCPPCRDELPLLQELHQSKSAKVILINVGEGYKIANNTLKKLNIKHLKTYLGKEDILSNLSIYNLPASIIYRNKKPTYFAIGELPDNQTTRQWLACLKRQAHDELIRS